MPNDPQRGRLGSPWDVIRIAAVILTAITVIAIVVR